MNFDPPVREAFEHFYNMDYSGAVERLERYHRAHPGDPHATALLLDAVIFGELNRRDTLDTSFYLNDGFLGGRHALQEDPQVRDRIFALADEAVNEADWRIGRNANDVDALFDRAWARALRCTYVAMVERAFGVGFRLAIKAKDDAERVLQLEPNYADARLITGIYQYVVGALPLPFKLLIGVAGITGSKTNGLAQLRDAGARGTVTGLEARTAMAFFLRRDSHYPEAMELVRAMKHQYPRNFLFCLEEVNLRKDLGEGMAAVEAYRSLLAQAAQPGYFAEPRPELAAFGLGEALRGQHHLQEAAAAYEQSAGARNASPELRVRSLLAAGQCRDLAGERQLALHDYQDAIAAGPNTSRADFARKLLRSPYRGN